MAWKYGQTPQFTFSIEAGQQKGSSQPHFTFEDGSGIDISFKARSGIITESDLTQRSLVKLNGNSRTKQQNPFLDVNLYLITDWLSILENKDVKFDKYQLSRWLNSYFPAIDLLP